MSPDEAASLLESTIGDPSGYAWLTLAPYLEQREAMRTVDVYAIAPSSVCRTMHRPIGSTWGLVLMEVRSHHDIHDTRLWP